MPIPLYLLFDSTQGSGVVTPHADLRRHHTRVDVAAASRDADGMRESRAMTGRCGQRTCTNRAKRPHFSGATERVALYSFPSCPKRSIGYRSMSTRDAQSMRMTILAIIGEVHDAR